MTGDDRADLDPVLEERLRRGLALLAEQTPVVVRRRSWVPAAAAAAAVVLAAALATGLALGRDDGRPPRHQAGPPAASSTPTSGGPVLGGQQVPYDLDRLVRESSRVVVGTVGEVTHGAPSDASGGLAYVLAEIEVEQVLRGPAGSRLVAFDYDYGAALSAGAVQGASFVRGERVLLFLSSTDGTVHADLSPPHWQVTGGAAGEYAMRGDEPEAPFSLEQVQQEVSGR